MQADAMRRKSSSGAPKVSDDRAIAGADIQKMNAQITSGSFASTRKGRVTWRAKTQYKSICCEGLAEGVRLGSNLLLSWCDQRPTWECDWNPTRALKRQPNRARENWHFTRPPKQPSKWIVPAVEFRTLCSVRPSRHLRGSGEYRLLACGPLAFPETAEQSEPDVEPSASSIASCKLLRRTRADQKKGPGMGVPGLISSSGRRIALGSAFSHDPAFTSS
jgi:hypothetical protein